MSPRNPLPRLSPKQYAQAVRQRLPVKQAIITWQAKPLDGEFWQVVTYKGETLATVADTVTEPKISAQNAAQLMADAPLLLNELALAHELIRAAFSIMDRRTTSLILEKASLGIDSEGTTRANERLALLVKHSHLGGGQ